MRYQLALMNGGSTRMETAVWVVIERNSNYWTQCGGNVCLGPAVKIGRSTEGELSTVNNNLTFWDGGTRIMQIETPLSGTFAVGDSGRGTYNGPLERLSSGIEWRVIGAM